MKWLISMDGNSAHDYFIVSTQNLFEAFCKAFLEYISAHPQLAAETRRPGFCFTFSVCPEEIDGVMRIAHENGLTVYPNSSSNTIKNFIFEKTEEAYKIEIEKLARIKDFL